MFAKFPRVRYNKCPLSLSSVCLCIDSSIPWWLSTAAKRYSRKMMIADIYEDAICSLILRKRQMRSIFKKITIFVCCEIEIHHNWNVNFCRTKSIVENSLLYPVHHELGDNNEQLKSEMALCANATHHVPAESYHLDFGLQHLIGAFNSIQQQCFHGKNNLFSQSIFMFSLNWSQYHCTHLLKIVGSCIGYGKI